MDNSRKHDSIGTKSHSTASSSSAVSSCMQAASNLQQTSTATTSSASSSAPPPPPTPEQNTASSNAIMSSSTTASATSSTAIMSSAAAGNNGMLLSGSSQPSSAVAAATAPAAAPAAVNSTSASIAPSATTALAMLPHYSASSFSLPHPGSSSALGAGIGSGVPASFGGGAASTTSSSSKNVQRPAVFDKLESLVQDMQDKVHGVPVRHQKVFLTSIPFAFMGYDLIEWLMDRLSIEDSCKYHSLEAVHLANLLCQFGYYFPIGELKNLLVKDDSSLYRFQSPYYWPSQHHTPDNIEYAIYLAKRSQQRKREKHGLEDYEVEAYNNLKKILANKWDFVMMQSEEQLRVAKDRKRDDKQIIDSQEKAYWRVYRPPPGYTTVVESSPVPTREHRIKARSRTKEHILEEVKFLREYASMIRCKVAQVADNLIDYTDTFFDFDPVLNSVGPSSPWITDDQTYWLLNQPIVDTPTEKRVRKWEISLDDLVVDPLGVKELMEYMKKEYSHENLRFWLSVQELRYGSGTEAKIKKKVKEIWDEFLSPGAKAEINIDGKTMEATKVAMKSPSRYTFEVAAGHIYLLLLKKDCYPRFIRSENYKAILANAINPGNVKRRIFNFPRVPKRPLKSAAPACTGSGTNTHQAGRMPEDFNVYGIHGAGQGDSPPDGHEDFPTTTRDGGEYICPWELDDSLVPGKKDEKKPGGLVRRGSDPTALASNTAKAATSSSTKSRTSVHPTGMAAALAATATSMTTPLEAAAAMSSAPRVVPRVVPRASTKSAEQPSTTTTTNDQEKSASASTILDPGVTKCSSHPPCDSGGSSGSQEKHRHSESGTASSGVPHHHHHHHHHHHVASKRAKNRSRKKKPSRAASSAGDSTTMDNEIPAGGDSLEPAAAGGHPKFHPPPVHQHSAASLLSSVAATSMAMASIDGSNVTAVKTTLTVAQPTATSGAVASATISLIPPMLEPTTLAASKSTTAAAAASTTSVSETSSKCTQTKLDDDDEAAAAAFLLGSEHETVASKDDPQPPTSSIAATVTSHPEGSSKPMTSVGSSTMILASKTSTNPITTTTTTSTLNKAETNQQSAVAEGAVGGAGHGNNSESKGELGTWTSSTEVCPWEDEDNRKESHAPFVKTYATLGYL